MNIACTVCGSIDLAYQDVLWDQLVRDWQLTPEEIIYINRQQGFHCRQCGNNLRSMALAQAIAASFGFRCTLNEFVTTSDAAPLRILEINSAGNLSPTLSKLQGHRLLSYPEIDMHDMPITAGSLDLVIHSDTLEHVTNPVVALSECRRVLAPGGRCIFTVPIIVGRMSRSRAGLPLSFHGTEKESDEGLAVRTEFGADVWTFVLRAGFQSVKIHSLEYPAGTAIEAIR